MQVSLDALIFSFFWKGIEALAIPDDFGMSSNVVEMICKKQSHVKAAHCNFE